VIPPLTDLHVRLVAKCNLNCKHCYASDWFVRADQLDVDLVCRAIDQACEMGLKKVTLTGGEPTLHRGVTAILQHCVDKGLKTKLETNGLLLRQNNGRLMQMIIDHRDLVYLYISYDLAEQRGIKQSDHEFIRAVAIELHEHGVDVRLQTTLTEVNIEFLEDLLELPRKYGVHQRIFLGHSTSGNGSALSTFQAGCGWGLHRCEIMPNGDITTCGPITFTHTGFVAGNVRERPLQDIWRDSRYFEEMREIKQEDFDGVCGRCTYWEECRGSCRSVSWTRGASWFSPYPLCQLYAERYPEKVAGLLHPIERDGEATLSRQRQWLVERGTPADVPRTGKILPLVPVP
jgi:radical SAM protein with 4Fe4S-binding SPASM domain